MTRPQILDALDALDDITRRLRRECPWDREQDERSIVPHTVEEAYELADAAQRGDDAKLLDELGDVLFQVHFLALLLEERGAGDLAAVAEHCRQKLIRRHPHVFGDVEAARGAAGLGGPEAARPSQEAARDAPRSKTLSAQEVLANWDAIKRAEAGREPGVFGDVPENLPGPLYARKMQRRAASAGRHEAAEDPREALARLDAGEGEARATALGDALFALVDLARRERIDPELALRAAVERFRVRAQLDPEPPPRP